MRGHHPRELPKLLEQPGRDAQYIKLQEIVRAVTGDRPANVIIRRPDIKANAGELICEIQRARPAPALLVTL